MEASPETLPRAIEAVQELDGRSKTEFILERTDRVLIIGGGNGGYYNVLIAVDIDRVFYNLIDPEGASDHSIELVTGGQAADFPARNCVRLPAALKAVQAFCFSGEPAPDLVWEE